jgi:CRISPR/Cas system type I-B associated protein Csh2 (Cas7 group RAMP superfamily)
MSGNLTNYTDEDLEALEEELLEKAEKDQEEAMPISGKSVFDIQKMKHEKLGGKSTAIPKDPSD